MKIWMAFLIMLGGAGLQAGELVLAENGRSDYVIVSEDQSMLGKLAVRELQEFFKKATGAELKTGTFGPKRILLGMSDEVRGILGGDLPEDQEAFIRVHGNDLILVGGGKHGTLYAVYCFLENQLGIRWFTPWDTRIPSLKKLTVGDLNEKIKPAFETRCQGNWMIPRNVRDMFYFRNRNNLTNLNKPPELSLLPMEYAQSHLLFSYIRPENTRETWDLEWPNEEEKKKTYFKDHPEYFSMNSQGKRVSGLQLCFSSREMRKEFLRRLEIQIETKGKGKGIFNVSAMDWPGKFCFCKDCQALEKKYGCTGGPHFDFIIELGNSLKAKYPEAFISTLAYRKKQSEFPPVNVEKFPDNVIIIFAPVDDDVTKTLDHPNNAETYENLKKWTGLAKRVWVWYYVYYGGTAGVTERLGTDIRLIHDAGATGTFFEIGGNKAFGLNFNPMIDYLVMKQFQNPDSDHQVHVKEFMEFYYGSAAHEVMAWHNELEAYRKAIKKHLTYDADASEWGYFTPENTVRVEKMFDRLEEKTKDELFPNANVKTLRIDTDRELLRHFPAVKARYPEFAGQSEAVFLRLSQNLADTVKRRGGHANPEIYLKPIREFLEVAEIEPLPLPPEFAVITDRKIIRLIPNRSRSGIREEMDDAAWGFAYGMEVKEPAKGLACGFYDETTTKQTNITLTADQVKPGVFQVYKVAAVPLAGRCRVWAHPTWGLGYGQLGQFFKSDDPHKKWDIHVSLKFTGPDYGQPRPDNKNMVFIDQIVLLENK